MTENDRTAQNPDMEREPRAEPERAIDPDTGRPVDDTREEDWFDGEELDADDIPDPGPAMPVA